MNLVECRASEFTDYKTLLLKNSRVLSPFYQPYNTAYFQCYFAQAFDKPSEDLSFCIELGKKPLLLVMMTSAQNNRLSYLELPIAFIWCEDISAKAKKGANKVALKHLATLCKTTRSTLLYQEPAAGSLSEFGRYLLKQNYAMTSSFNQNIDLQQTSDDIFSDIRKIFRANIRWGQKNLTLKVLTSQTIQTDDIEAFRQLHIEITGTETRSQQSWQAQEAIIKNGEGFAIYGYLEDKLVSTGLFLYSQSDCYYSVGAYDRSLFDKPIAHALVWRAIEVAKELGCLRFIVGEAFFGGLALGSGELPCAKELAISHFKQGFGGDLVATLAFAPPAER